MRPTGLHRQMKSANQEYSEERPVIPVDTHLELLGEVPPGSRAMLLLATFANLRFGELAGLRRNQIGLEACAVRVVISTAEMGGGRLIDDDPKSRAGRRTVAFPKEIVPELRWHMECFAEAVDGGLVFVGPKGGRLRIELPLVWNRAGERSGFPNCIFRPRHPETRWRPPGASLRKLMERMGRFRQRAALTLACHATARARPGHRQRYGPATHRHAGEQKARQTNQARNGHAAGPAPPEDHRDPAENSP